MSGKGLGQGRGMERVEATMLKGLCYKHQCAGASENQPRREKDKEKVEGKPRQWQRLLHRAKREEVSRQSQRAWWSFHIQAFISKREGMGRGPKSAQRKTPQASGQGLSLEVKWVSADP